MEIIRSISGSRSRRISRRRSGGDGGGEADHSATCAVNDVDGQPQELCTTDQRHTAIVNSCISKDRMGRTSSELSGRFLSPALLKSKSQGNEAREQQQVYDIFPTESDDGISCQHSYEVSLTPRSSFSTSTEQMPHPESTFSALSAINVSVKSMDDEEQQIDLEKTSCHSDDDSSHGSSNSDDDGADDDENSNTDYDADGLFSQDEKKLVGTILADKYRILKELGRGTFGRVMECYEIDQTKLLEQVGLGNWRGTLRAKKRGLRAIKIIRNVEQYRKDAEIEADLLRKVNRSDGDRGCRLFPIVHDTFDLPTGQYCLVLEKLGDSLYDIIKKNDGEGFASQYVREISIQLFDALDHLHSKLHLIHTDIKPENILLVDNNTDEEDVRIKIIDMGSAVFGCTHDDDGSGSNGYSVGLKTSIVNTRQYRAPEILLRTGWSYPSDVWAAGCTIAELALGCLLFPTKSTIEHLAMIEKKVGQFPKRMLDGEMGTKCFDLMSARHKMASVLTPESLDYVENECSPLKEELPDDAWSSMYNLLSTVLTLDPWKRPNAKKALVLARKIHVVEIEE